MTYDFSTIDLSVLEARPTYTLPAGHHLGDMGNGCAGDPPGFPTYFTRAVYNQRGDTPRDGWNLVISHNKTIYGIEHVNWAGTWEEHRAKLDTLFRRLWKTLPIDHPRTVAWIKATFAHHAHCYQDPNGKGSWSDNLVIYPVPKYKLESFTDDPRFSDEWRTQEQTRIAEENAKIEAATKAIATIDNHDAVIIVRKYYPDFVPTDDLFGKFERPGNWWERHAENFTPETCPGQYSMKHPTGKTWCQMCGWKE